jgi:hypothetical protein
VVRYVQARRDPAPAVGRSGLGFFVKGSVHLLESTQALSSLSMVS